MPDKEKANEKPQGLLEFYMDAKPFISGKLSLWELFHGWNQLMDFACGGISLNSPAVVDIYKKEERITMRVCGEASAEKAMVFLERFRNCPLNEKLPCGQGDDCIPFYILFANSLDATLCATYNHRRISLSIEQNNLANYECGDDDSPNQWTLSFTPNPNLIAEPYLGSAFKAECFRRVCAYSEALTIRLNECEMHERKGLWMWLELFAPSRNAQKDTFGARLFVSSKYDVAFSFRPKHERRCGTFLSGHLLGDDAFTTNILCDAFNDFITKTYGLNAVSHAKDFGYVAVLSILDKELYAEHNRNETRKRIVSGLSDFFCRQEELRLFINKGI